MGRYMYCRTDEKVGTGEQVGGEGQVMGKGGKGVTAGQEGVAGSKMIGELVCGREKQSRRESMTHHAIHITFLYSTF